MRPRSRTLLVVVVALALATTGCLGGPDAPGSPTTGGSPTESPSSITSAATALPGEPVEWPDGPKERPARPPALNESSVGDFARTYEYRYVYNTLWYDESSDVFVECELDRVDRRGDAWRAVVTCTAYSNTGGGTVENGTGTSTVVHADYFTQTWVYWIDEDAVHRKRAEE